MEAGEVGEDRKDEGREGGGEEGRRACTGRGQCVVDYLHAVGEELACCRGGRRSRPGERCGSRRRHLHAKGERLEAMLPPEERSKGHQVVKSAMIFLVLIGRVSPSDCQGFVA